MEMLERFVQGTLDATLAALVVQKAGEVPEVGAAIDRLKRAHVDRVLEAARVRDPQAFIESGVLEAYLQESLSDAERQEVEMMAQVHPSVDLELKELEAAHLQLISEIVAKPSPIPSKQRFLEFLQEEDAKAQDNLPIRPPYLNALSTADDYAQWIRQGANPNPAEYENMFVQPLDADADCLTLLVWVKSEIEGEVHLDAIEKFLVLEGACIVEMDGVDHHLKAGDVMSIPKFKRHTVQVTSIVPCKLIVQQIAA